MGAIAEMVKCSCGGLITETTETMTWKDSEGISYTILNVPVLRCDNCEDELYPSDVQYSISWLADEMRKGNLPNSVEYRNIFN